MYFFVKYIDYEDFKRLEDVESVEAEDCYHIPGQNKELIVNPDCYTGIILDYIFKEAGIEEESRSNFDLASDKARLVNITPAEPDSNGLNFFIEKATYYIVYKGSNNQLRPLLNRASKEYLEFCVNQRRRFSVTKKRSSFNKSTRQGSQTFRSNTSRGSQAFSTSSKDKWSSIKSSKSNKSAISGKSK